MWEQRNIFFPSNKNYHISFSSFLSLKRVCVENKAEPNEATLYINETHLFSLNFQDCSVQTVFLRTDLHNAQLPPIDFSPCNYIITTLSLDTVRFKAQMNIQPFGVVDIYSTSFVIPFVFLILFRTFKNTRSIIREFNHNKTLCRQPALLSIRSSTQEKISEKKNKKQIATEIVAQKREQLSLHRIKAKENKRLGINNKSVSTFKKSFEENNTKRARKTNLFVYLRKSVKKNNNNKTFIDTYKVKLKPIFNNRANWITPKAIQTVKVSIAIGILYSHASLI